MDIKKGNALFQKSKTPPIVLTKKTDLSNKNCEWDMRNLLESQLKKEEARLNTLIAENLGKVKLDE